jgi:O-antigen ligase
MSITQFVNVLVNTLSLLVVFSLVLAVGLPQYGRAGMDGTWSADQIGAWRGCFNDKNGLGGTAAVALASILLFWKQWGLPLPFRLLALASAIAGVVFARSANGIVGVVVIAGVYVLFLGRVGQVRSVLTWAIIFGLVFSVATSSVVPMIADALGRDATLNGRTPIWVASIGVWQRSWIHGFGYVQGSLLVLQPELMNRLGIAARHAHNGYIEVLVDTGVVGLATLLAALLAAVIRASRVPSFAPASMKTATSVLLAIVAGSMAMAGGDVTAFRLVGGWGVIVWAAIVAISDVPQRYALLGRKA